MIGHICQTLKDQDVEIKEYNGYFVASNGKIFNKRGRELKPASNLKGYKFVSFSHKGKTKNEMLHRVLAKCFIPNPNNYPQINHKDGNKSNNKLDNLEWCTPSQNVQHAWDNGLALLPDKPVICLNTGVVYKTARKAADSLNFHSPSAITACCLGKRKSAYKGCFWRYYKPTPLIEKLRNAGFKKYPKDDSKDEYIGFLSVVMQWLRQEKSIEVVVLGQEYIGGPYFADVFTKDGLMNKAEPYPTYEQAALAGISYCLDNLL